MARDLPPAFELGSAVINAAVVVAVLLAVVRSLALILRGAPIERSRSILVHGMLTGLSLTAAASVLRLISARDWHDIAMTAVILLLRTMLKQALNWEERRLERRGDSPRSGRLSEIATISPSGPPAGG